MNLSKFKLTKSGGYRCEGFWAVPHRHAVQQKVWLVACGWYDDDATYWVDEEFIRVIADAPHLAAKRAFRHFYKYFYLPKTKNPRPAPC